MSEDAKRPSKIELYPMEKVSKDSVYYKELYKNILFGDSYLFDVVYQKDEHDLYEQIVVIPKNDSLAYLYTIPEIHIFYPSSTYSCYKRSFMKNINRYASYCKSKVRISSKMKENLDYAFDHEFMSIYGLDETKLGAFDFFHVSQGSIMKNFKIVMSSDAISNLNDFFKYYKNIYTDVKENLLKIASECTWEKVTQYIEKECGVEYSK